MRFKLIILGALGIGLAGCSTAPIVPDINSFGQAVTGITSADAKTAKAKSLPKRVADARREDFAAEKVLYSLSDPILCSYSDQQLNLVRQKFSDQCKLVPMKLRGDELIVVASEYDSFAAQEAAAHVVAARNEALLKEHLGHGIRADLLAYSKALSELATTKEPAKLGASTGAAFDALTGLKDTVSAAAKSDGKSAPASSLRAPSKSLLTLAATEIAEAMRYRRLRSLVEFADPFVQEASVQLSVLTYGGERAGFETKSTALSNAIGDADVSSANDLKTVEEAHKALLDADDKARFRVYSQIGNAHSAILAALKAPQDYDRLSDANARIIALAEAIKNFAEAI